MRQRMGGFTLIEILITTLVFGLGLLGVSALNGKGQQVTYTSYQAQVATWQINDLIEQIRTNEDTAGSYLFDPATDDKSDYSLQGCLTDLTDADGCTPTQLAQHTLRQWLDEADTLLPSGTGKVESLGGGDYRITLMWDQDRTGATGTGCGSDPDVDLHCLSMTFEIRT